MAKSIKLYIHIGLVGCKKEEIENVPDDWDEMTNEEKEEYLDDIANNYLHNNIDYGAYLIEE